MRVTVTGQPGPQGETFRATALVPATQRPTVMKYAYRTATQLYSQESQPHQTGLLGPLSHRELTASSLGAGPVLGGRAFLSGPQAFEALGDYCSPTPNSHDLVAWRFESRVWVVLESSYFSPRLTFPPQSFL